MSGRDEEAGQNPVLVMADEKSGDKLQEQPERQFAGINGEYSRQREI